MPRSALLINPQTVSFPLPPGKLDLHSATVPRDDLPLDFRRGIAVVHAAEFRKMEAKETNPMLALSKIVKGGRT